MSTKHTSVDTKLDMAHEFGRKYHDNFVQTGNTVIVKHETEGPLSELGFAFEVRTWMDDLLQVIPGANSTACSQKLPDSEQHPCPHCQSSTSKKLKHISENLYWGDDFSCECGADYDEDDIGCTNFEVSDEKLEAGKKNFQHWNKRSVPSDAAILYGWLSPGDKIENPRYPTVIIGVELADETRVIRERYTL